MRRTAAALACVAALAGAAGLVAPVGSAVAGSESGGVLVGEQPVAGTPQVLDGEVFAIAQVGGTIVLGGSFTRARDDGSDVELPRRGLLAFDAATGRIDPAFHPDPDGVVEAVTVGRSGSVYVGGEFSSIGGLPRAGLAQVALAGGAVVPAFDPGRVDGPVRDLRLRHNRLWVAGAFTRIGGRKQRALAVLAARTGRTRSTPQVRLAGQARHGLGRTAVTRIDLSPNGRYLAVVGNFRSVQRERRAQLAVLDLRHGAAVTSFRTRFYAATCQAQYYSYVRDVDFAPDGSYFVVATSGGPGGPGSPCDSVARFETRGADRAARPSWIASTGGDTLQAVEVTAGAVYVGGHQRWLNNPFGANTAGPGAVVREGIAALSPVNGLPFTWNPGRSKGVGVGDLLATGAGLWVGSDTDRIGGQVRARIALLPAGGLSYPAALAPPRRLATVYSARGGELVRRSHRASRAGPPSTVPGGPDWTGVAGAFLLGGQLYVAGRDGSFTRRAFDGMTYGPPEPVAAADGLVPLLAWRAELATVTGLFYDGGRIYFTLAGSRALHYRYFNPQSGIVGADRLVASRRVGGFAPRRVRGMFVAGRHLYWVTGSGRLRRTGWLRTAQAAEPSGEASDVGGPKVDGVRWGPGVVFAGPPARRGG
ncbi:hypothetical protein [Nocardioides nitrophenolicus]|uniref:hypothetical protein n=1 Tax=Nocardioides nitrophenolicus TaxID=60489 RepID=UPI001957B7DB|nr:hypothetical protein [Nocardioides nitrophenolicus]MBM7518328.1 hypothetical protein [Nocardioides nitrophenolicus]